jgi:hypothetical protein
MPPGRIEANALLELDEGIGRACHNHVELSTTSTGSPPPPYCSAHSSSVGIRPMTPILPSSCCTSTLSRHRAGCRFLSQKMQAVVSGG